MDALLSSDLTLLGFVVVGLAATGAAIFRDTAARAALERSPVQDERRNLNAAPPDRRHREDARGPASAHASSSARRRAR